MNLEQPIMPTLPTIPEDLRLFIVSKVGSTSSIDYFNTIITCKSLSFGPANNSIARSLNLSPLVNKPFLGNQYRTLVDQCLETNNPDAHFVKGMIEYFKSQNQILGLHHIRIASKAGHIQGTYVYGILLMALGKTEKGVKIINNFTDDKGISMVETCMASFKRSMDHTFLHVKEIYVSSMKKMWPELNCHPQEGADITVCSKCYHLFLLTEFYTMMLGFNDILG